MCSTTHIKIEKTTKQWGLRCIIYLTWKTYYVYQTTPYELNKKHDKCGI
nr:MAG TPA: hypothetical protein [Bacteriophage sp.]DAW84114.1 MAG TPA: hypothetical protein [Bacteriophage sp.]DAY13631.1 MAG TPA: hypothetical protein [Bacteriophage sp.]